MTTIDTEAFAKAFSDGMAAALGKGESQPEAPSAIDLAKAVRENPELEVEKIVERWEGLQPEAKPDDKPEAQADDKAEGEKPKVKLEDLFTKATEAGEASTNGSGKSDTVDIMGDQGARHKALQGLFS